MNNKYTSRVLPGALLGGVVFLMSAWTSHSFAVIAGDPQACEPDNKVACVNIVFIKNCPKYVDKYELDVTKSKLVHWQAVNTDAKPINVDYKIYFDPFKGGKRLETHGNKGRLISPPFDDVAPPGPVHAGPAVGYEYTIVADKCPGEPLDPRFRLRR